MKKIKFRAWDKKYNKMVGVGGIKDLFSIRSDGTPSNPNYILMQFTGLKDKNGKEIYEKDILGREFFSDWCVIWKDCGFHIYNVCNPIPLYPLIDTTDREIIGNIYENPELLK